MISVVTSTAAAITTHGNHDSNNDNKHTEGFGRQKKSKLRARRLSSEFYVIRVKMTVTDIYIYNVTMEHYYYP